MMGHNVRAELRPGEIIVDSQRTADLLRSNHALRSALSTIEQLHEVVDALESAAREAKTALANEPEFDHLPQYIQVDSSWADSLPVCVACGKDVPWVDALLMPCSTTGHFDDADALGILHRSGCV